MSTLTNRTIATSYKDLLQVSNNNTGVDAATRWIEDGEGTPSILSISTTQIGIGTEYPAVESLLQVDGMLRAITLRADNIGINTWSPAVSIDVNTVDAIKIPKGTTAERPTSTTAEHKGYIRYNTTTDQFEGFGAGPAWGSLGGVIDVDQDTYVSAEDIAGDDNDELKFFTTGERRAIITDTGITLGGTVSAMGSSVFDDNVHIKGDLRVDGNAYLSAGAGGNINVGDSDNDNVVFNADVDSNIIPNTNKTHDLGSNSQQWRDLYVQGISATGSSTVDGSLTVGDSATVTNGTTTKDLSVTDSATVTNTTTTKDLSVTDSASVTNTTTTKDLSVTNGTTTKDLSVTDSATVTNTTTTKDLSVTNGTTTKDLSVTDSATVTNTTTTKDLSVTDSATVTNTTTTKDLSVTDSATVTNTTTTKDLSVTNGTTTKDLSVTDNASVTNTTTTKDLSVTNGTTTKDLTVTGSTGTQDLVVAGTLTVNGTTTTINSTTLSVDDKNIEIGSINTPTDATANGGGITLKGTTDKTILWSNTSQSWNFSENVILNDGKYLYTDKVQARDTSGLSLFDDGGNGIFVKDGGDVGIGTTSPDAKLVVIGQGKFVRNSVNPCLSIQQSGSGPTAIFLGGNVGIGTSSPEVPLMIKANSGTDSMIKLLDEKAYVEGEARSSISFQGNDTAGARTAFGGIEAYGASGQRGGLRFLCRPDANTTATGIVLNESSNVGIGTTSPKFKLDVADPSTMVLGGSDDGLGVTDNAFKSSRIGGIAYTNASKPVNMMMHTSSATESNLFIGWGTGSMNCPTKITFGTAANTTTSSSTAANKRMVIDSGGNVGIGTTSPNANLEVVNSSNTVTTSKFYNGGGSAPATVHIVEDGTASDHVGLFVGASDLSSAVLITKRNNVGIGTTSPNCALHIEGNNNTRSQIRLRNTANTPDPADFFLTPVYSSNQLQIRNSNAVPIMVMNGDGTAGIGNAVTSHKFCINAQLNNSPGGLFIDSSTRADEIDLINVRGDLSTSNSTIFTVKSKGNVGIGTAAPNYRLTVEDVVDSDWISRIYNKGTGGTAGNGLLVRSDATNADNKSVFGVHADGNFKFLVKSTGNVGIGTTDPGSKLVVHGDNGDNNGDVALRIHNPNAGSTTTSSIRFSNTTSAFDHAAIVATREGTGSHLGSLTFYTNQNFKPNNAAMIIDSFGNVGIGNAPHNAPYPYYKNLKVGKSSTLMCVSDESAAYDQLYLQSNYYVHSDGTNRAYGAGYPTSIGLSQGQLVFSASPTIASAAGDTQSLNTVMTVNRFGTTTVNVGGNPGAGRHTIKQYQYNDTANYFRVQDLNSAAISEIGLYREAAPTSGAVDAWSYWLATCRNSTTNNIIYSDNQTLKMATSFASANAGGGSIVGSQTSDERLKDIHENFSYGLSDVLKLKPISYTLKEDTSSTTKLGFGAQTTQPIIPETVRDTGDCIDGYEQPEDEDSLEMIPKSDDTKLEMEYVQLIPVLTKAIQEQQALIEDLKNRINTLENK